MKGGVGCVGGGGERKEGGRGEGWRRRGQLTAWNLRTHTSNPFSLAWFVTFAELEKVLNFASRADTATILRSAIARVKGECHFGTYHGECLACHL